MTLKTFNIDAIQHAFIDRAKPVLPISQRTASAITDSTSRDPRETLRSFIRMEKELSAVWDVSSKEYCNRDQQNEAYAKLIQVITLIKKDASREDVNKINAPRTNLRKE
jgi:hypothetical protein